MIQCDKIPTFIAFLLYLRSLFLPFVQSLIVDHRIPWLNLHLWVIVRISKSHRSASNNENSSHLHFLLLITWNDDRCEEVLKMMIQFNNWHQVWSNSKGSILYTGISGCHQTIILLCVWTLVWCTPQVYMTVCIMIILVLIQWASNVYHIILHNFLIVCVRMCLWLASGVVW